ncbi:MAG TPA: YqzL family protein [Clostridiales bacterium]|jgi:hypothetical protein|nr:YqzL family protein [Clostridiales bacterium]
MFFGDDLSGLSWKLFSATGEIGYYMLYKRLNELDDEVNPPVNRDKFD